MALYATHDERKNYLSRKPFRRFESLRLRFSRSLAGMVNFSRVPQQWDDEAILRRRASKGRTLMVSAVKGVSHVLGNIKNVAENQNVLLPLVTCMSQWGRVDTPSIEVLTPLVIEFYSLAGYPDPTGLEAVAHQDAWGIKRCLTLLRRKWSRAETPKDLWILIVFNHRPISSISDILSSLNSPAPGSPCSDAGEAL